MKNTLKVYRAMHDMTQEDLSKVVGCTRQTINAMEKKKYAPSTLLALKIARHFQVPVETLFQLEETD